MSIGATINSNLSNHINCVNDDLLGHLVSVIIRISISDKRTYLIDFCCSHLSLNSWLASTSGSDKALETRSSFFVTFVDLYLRLKRATNDATEQTTIHGGKMGHDQGPSLHHVSQLLRLRTLNLRLGQFVFHFTVMNFPSFRALRCSFIVCILQTH